MHYIALAVHTVDLEPQMFNHAEILTLGSLLFERHIACFGSLATEAKTCLMLIESSIGSERHAHSVIYHSIHNYKYSACNCALHTQKCTCQFMHSLHMSTTIVGHTSSIGTVTITAVPPLLPFLRLYQDLLMSC